MKPEEVSIIGVVLLLFGITWVLYGVSPHLNCIASLYGASPECSELGTISIIWDLLGVASIGAGAVMLGLRKLNTS